MTRTVDVLSGPWALSWRAWAAGNILASFIVIAQELATPLPGAGWIAASALLQLVISSIWGFAVAAISRRRHGRVVPVALGLMWTGIGVGRGVGGALVAAAAGLDPEWIFRIGFWTLVSVCWMPLLTYTLAQWDAHRRLLALRADLARDLDEAAARAVESDDDRNDRMSVAADDALRPALDEIRSALRQNATLDDSSVGAIAARLDALATLTADYTASAPVRPLRRDTRRVSVAQASQEFELRRPVFASLLAAAATAPAILPEAYRDDGWFSVAEAVGALVAATAVLIGVFGLLQPSRFSGAQRSVLSRIGVTLSGLAGTGILLLYGTDPGDARDAVLLVLFPLVFVTAASTTATAVALPATNDELEAYVATDRAALEDLTARVHAADEEAGIRLERLVRGEVNGLVASCALAIGMLADESLPSAARARVIAGVLEQLDAAAADLRPHGIAPRPFSEHPDTPYAR